MKKITKTAIVSFGTVALLLGGAGAGYAASNWQQGHANMVQTQANLDKLANQLSKDKTKLENKQQELQQAKNTQADLQKQLEKAQSDYQLLKNNDYQEKIQAIQNEVQRGNDRVAEKQKEVNALNDEVSDLKRELDNKKQPDSDSDMAQAITDAQDTRDKSDQLVNQYVEK
ncbi:hypothetical protein PS393_01230 [Limosilactobacillus fermentum]